MKGDFTRFTFDAEKHFRNVLTQQGRVTVDADPNEQQFITSYLIETEAADLIGGCGAPMHDAGFKIESVGQNLTIGKGRYYVDGILCENETDKLAIGAQADLPSNAVVIEANGTTTTVLQAGSGLYLAYLDVWLRHVTALEDDSIREKALGGPDTATRVKTAWQVRLVRIGDPGAQFNCSSESAIFNDLKAGTTGKMRARAEVGAADDKPCVVPPGAGFRRLENQLYRVEVHSGGALGTATFKWSRDNGSIVTKWSAVAPNPANPASHVDLTVGNIGRDKVLRFAGGQWVELTDDTREETVRTGIFVQVVKAEGEIVTVDKTTAFEPNKAFPAPINFADFPKNPKVRRWDFRDKPQDMKIVQPAAPNDWLKLEDGLEVKFENGNYRTGDYWLIPARTVEPFIEWPKETGVNPPPAALSPHGVEHHYCRLALATHISNGFWNVISDCRKLFPPVTELTSLFYVSGDGQEAMPGEALLRPLQVGVANGQWPVPDAHVRFKVLGGTGTITTSPQNLVQTISPTELIARTNAQGVAECNWTLDSSNESQTVETTLVDGTHLPVRFNANLSRAQDVAYTPTSKCPDLVTAGVKNVKEALDRLCQTIREPGIHVKDVLLLTGPPLRNDTNIPVPEFIKGIRVVCDAEVFQDSVRNKPVCFVTLDLPFPFNSADRQLWGSDLLGFQPLILDAQVNADNNVIFWIPTAEVQAWLQQRLFVQMREFKRGERVLLHLTLKGNFIWEKGNPDLFLDGEVFGVQRGTNTDVRLPSGDGRRGGDLEMWFWLTPPAVSLKVSGVRVLSLLTAAPVVLATMVDPRNVLAVPVPPNSPASVIEVQFTAPVDTASIVSGRNFTVLNLATGAAMQGALSFVNPSTVRLSFPNTLPIGRYQVSLRGTGDAITSQGVALDGEPTGLPSGNNEPGGDFSFNMSIGGTA